MIEENRGNLLRVARPGLQRRQFQLRPNDCEVRAGVGMVLKWGERSRGNGIY